jgi:hypothetical protein
MLADPARHFLPPKADYAGMARVVLLLIPRENGLFRAFHAGTRLAMCPLPAQWAILME